MAVSEPLRLGDKLREALADAQHVLESTDLRGKIKLDVTTSGGSSLADVEASIDRTEADAKGAGKDGGGGGGGGVGVMDGGPLSPTNKLIDALEKLVKSMDGVPDALDKAPGSRRRRRPAAGEAPSDDEAPSSGYMNPYLLQGMVQNPLGTMRGMGSSMLMGGSGLGMKPPEWLSSMLGGSSGEFSVGKALGAPTLTGEAGASAFMAPGAMVAAAVATLVAAFTGTFKIMSNIADSRAQDASGRVEDFRFGQGAGINWRGSTWLGGGMQSRSDIDAPDIRELVGASGLSFEGMARRRGNWQMMGGIESGSSTGMQSAINTALQIGITPSQMGSVLGAGVRGGTLDINGANGTEQMVRYLGLIEQWTSKAKDYGLSTSEALAAMASDSASQAASSHGLVTDSATRQMLSLRTNLEARGMDRPAVQAMTDALGAQPHSEVERVIEMNEFLGADEQLTRTGRAWAVEALGADRVAAMEKTYGRAAGTMISYAAGQTRTGATHARAAASQRFRRHGGSSVGGAITFYNGDVVAEAMAGAEGGESSARMGNIFSDREGGIGVGAGVGNAGGPSEEPSIGGENALRRQARVQTASSAVSSEWAAATLASQQEGLLLQRQTVGALTSLPDRIAMAFRRFNNAVNAANGVQTR
jgi:hypothetical protein